MRATTITYQQNYSNHLGNVLSVVTDHILEVEGASGVTDYFTADLVSSSDYYPFGSQMVGRSFSSNQYKFGYQGSEKDNEVTGVTGSYITTYFREYDTRIGRTWSIDPKGGQMPWQSPYVSMDNNPVFYNDPLGDKVRNAHKKAKEKAEEDVTTAEETQKEAEGILNAFNGDKKAKGYRKAKRNFKKVNRKLKKANNYLKIITEKYDAAECLIEFMRVNYPDKFFEADNYSDIHGIIDVEVEAHSMKFYKTQLGDPVTGDVGEIGNGMLRTALGFAFFSKKKNAYGNRYFRVGVTFKIVSEDFTMENGYHEFRHVHYKFYPTELTKDEETQVVDDTAKEFPHP